MDASSRRAWGEQVEKDAIFIMVLAVDSDKQGQGRGGALIRYVQELVWSILHTLSTA